MAADYTDSQLTNLPPHVLDHILECLFTLDSALKLVVLASLGSRIHASARRVLARELILHDDDDNLVEAEEVAQPKEGSDGDSVAQTLSADHGDSSPNKSSLLAQVLKHKEWAAQVRSLVVVNPLPVVEEPTSTWEALAPVPVPPLPLHDAAFFLCLSKLENLTSFTWHSHRLPPEQLCLALGQACKNLTKFELDLVPSSSSSSGSHVAPTSPVLGQQQHQQGYSTSPTTTMHSPLAGGGASTSGAVVLARWDAPHLASLPDKLTHLSLSSLSATGAKNLAEQALPCLPLLEHLELAKTLFVDDGLLEAIGEHAKMLAVLKVREMGGTKLSENGLRAVLDGCTELRELHLEAVEGRLSRACWQKLTPLPPNLRVLRLSYSELAPHKSWVLDHLSSLSSLLAPSNSNLHTLALTRLLPSPNAAVPGSHHLSRYPIDPVLEPRTLGEKDLEALISRAEDGGGAREWERLELDLFKVEQDQLKKILEGCPKMRRLKVLLDAPFRNLLALAPSFAACPELQHLLLAIPACHSPEMASVTPAEYLAAVAPVFGPPDAATTGGAEEEGCSSPQQIRRGSIASTSTMSGSPTRTRSISAARIGTVSPAETDEQAPTQHDLLATSTARNCVHHPLEALDALLPPTKDWRRFLKKAHALERVTWTGRGGLGKWDFSQKKQGSSLAKVEFRPTKPVVPSAGGAGGEMEGSGGESHSPTRSRTRTASSSAGNGHFGGAYDSSPMSTYGGWDGHAHAGASPRPSRRRSSSISLAGSCLSNLSLSPANGPVNEEEEEEGGHSVFSSPATPFSTLMGLGTPSTTTTTKGGGGLFDAPCSPSEYELGKGNGHANGRRRSSASSSMFGAIGAAAAAGATSTGSTALGLSMPLAEGDEEQDMSFSLSAHQSRHAQDLFGWAADTAAATAGERAQAQAQARASSSYRSDKDKGASTSGTPASSPTQSKGHKAAASNKSLPALQTGSPTPKSASLTTTPSSSSLLPPAPAHLPPKPLSFAAAVSSKTAAPAAAAAMARTASATSAGSQSSTKSAGSSPTQGHGRSLAGGSGSGSGSGGGNKGGGGRSNRSRGKSASPKQERNANLPGTGGGAEGSRRSSGGGGGGAKKSGGGGSGGAGGGGGGGRRREATR
ncbi:hypothetical protein JCM10908_006331 [Rhodotorula pacifica]|uniref:uncharacterized protein n=1 Tax=Rhodotorula pacifica TaxID=1495444 RepID=UPI00316E9D03